MPINGNVLAKYLVMVSQVIAWCTVSVMLLRRGMNQVNAVQQSPLSYNNNNAYGSTAGTVQDGSRDDENATTDVTAATTGHRQDDETKSFDENGAPAVVAGIIMITIAVIMLIISPTIMLLKIIEKRKNRILDAELESPPKYDDVVESAPRYSSLFVFNDGEMALLSEDKHKEKDSIKKQFV